MSCQLVPMERRLTQVGFFLLLVLLVLVNLYPMTSIQRVLSVDYKVFGRVQGVFFRKYTKDKADQLGVRGWVQNDRDGTVIGVIQGTEDIVGEMKNWLTHKGSPHSRIDKCSFSNERVLDSVEFSGFTINRG